MENKCVDVIWNLPDASWRNFHISPLFGLRAPPVLERYLSVHVCIWQKHWSFSVLKFKLEKMLLQVTKCTQQYYKYQHLWVRKCRILIEWTELNIVTHHSNSNISVNSWSPSKTSKNVCPIIQLSLFCAFKSCIFLFSLLPLTSEKKLLHYADLWVNFVGATYFINTWKLTGVAYAQLYLSLHYSCTPPISLKKVATSREYCWNI